METKDTYKQKLKTQLKEWSAQIDLLDAKAENVGANVKIKYTRELDKLRAKLREATEKVKELEEASGDAWVEVKETADKVWDDLKTGVASVASKFK